jgi:phthalate 4,5-cis-dihydrodiol dehydrogenase
MNAPIRISIMGSGFIARTHAHAIAHGCNNALLAGIGGGSRAEKLAAEFGARFFPSPEALASDPDVDAAIIATPHNVHRNHALLCARYGKHVLLEKPMAPSVSECREIIEAFRSANLRLMMAFSQRFRQSNITAYDIIRAGRIGRILMVQEQALLANGLQAYPQWQQQPENLGILFGYGIHNIDRLRWFLQDEADCVTAHVLRSTGGIETSTMATLRWKCGALANLWSSVDIPAPGFEATAFRSLIVGDRGLLDLDGYGAVRLAGKDEKWETLFVQPAIDWRGDGMFSGARMGSFNAQDQAFVDAVLQNSEPPVTGTDGLRSVAIALAAYESASRNETVHPLTA